MRQCGDFSGMLHHLAALHAILDRRSVQNGGKVAGARPRPARSAGGGAELLDQGSRRRDWGRHQRCALVSVRRTRAGMFASRSARPSPFDGSNALRASSGSIARLRRPPRACTMMPLMGSRRCSKLRAILLRWPAQPGGIGGSLTAARELFPQSSATCPESEEPPRHQPRAAAAPNHQAVHARCGNRTAIPAMSQETPNRFALPRFPVESGQNNRQNMDQHGTLGSVAAWGSTRANVPDRQARSGRRPGT